MAPEVLARHGDLVVVRGNVAGTMGLYRETGEGKLVPPGLMDRGEWGWLAWGGVPVAMQALGPEPDPRAGRVRMTTERTT